MVSIRIKYLSDKIEKLRYIDGKSDWIDLRAAERVELKAGEFRLIPLGIAQFVRLRSGALRSDGCATTVHREDPRACTGK